MNTFLEALKGHFGCKAEKEHSSRRRMVFELVLAIWVEFWKIWGGKNGQRYFRGETNKQTNNTLIKSERKRI